MPTPRKGEKKKDFIKRCIPIVIEEGTAKDGAQGNAICNSIWRRNKQESDIIGVTFKIDGSVEISFQKRKPLVVQTLIMSKKKFPTRASAKAWAKAHGFKSNTIRENSSVILAWVFAETNTVGNP